MESSNFENTNNTKKKNKEDKKKTAFPFSLLSHRCAPRQPNSPFKVSGSKMTFSSFFISSVTLVPSSVPPPLSRFLLSFFLSFLPISLKTESVAEIGWKEGRRDGLDGRWTTCGDEMFAKVQTIHHFSLLL